MASTQGASPWALPPSATGSDSPNPGVSGAISVARQASRRIKGTMKAELKGEGCSRNSGGPLPATR